jgi:hypothetical protein
MLRTFHHPTQAARPRASRGRLAACLLAATISGGILAASPQQAHAAAAPANAATASTVTASTVTASTGAASTGAASTVTASTVTASTGAGAPVVGVQDGWINSCDAGSAPSLPHPGSAVPADQSPYWSRLGVTTVRFSPPWDIADHSTTSPAGKVLTVEQACFDYWLRDLAAHGVTPEIAFKPDYNYQSGNRIMIPDLSTYQAAMTAFTAQYSNCPGTPATCADGLARVSIIAPWGEPEFRGTAKAGTFHKLPQILYMRSGREFDATDCPAHATDANCGPALAAQMWVTVQHRCPACTVIAGDFGSNQGKDLAYLDIYHKFLRDLHGGHTVYRPAVWAIHPYTDVIAFERSVQQHRPLPALGGTLVGKFARQLRRVGFGSHTSIWLDEVSSFTVDFGGRHYSRAIQAAGAHDLLTYLPRAGGASVAGEPVVARIYYMRYAGAPHDALIVGGTREPVYWTFANRRK